METKTPEIAKFNRAMAKMRRTLARLATDEGTIDEFYRARDAVYRACRYLDNSYVDALETEARGCDAARAAGQIVRDAARVAELKRLRSEERDARREHDWMR